MPEMDDPDPMRDGIGDDVEDDAEEIWVAGANGTRYPAFWSKSTRRLVVRPRDVEEHDESLRDLGGLPVQSIAKAVLHATRAEWLPYVVKAYNPQELRDDHGRWSVGGSHGSGTDKDPIHDSIVAFIGKHGTVTTAQLSNEFAGHLGTDKQQWHFLLNPKKGKLVELIASGKIKKSGFGKWSLGDAAEAKPDVVVEPVKEAGVDELLPHDIDGMKGWITSRYGLVGVDFGQGSSVAPTEEWAQSEKGRKNIVDTCKTLDMIADVVGVPRDKVGMGFKTRLLFNVPVSWAGGNILGQFMPPPTRNDIATVLINPSSFSGGTTTLVHEWGHLIDYAANFPKTGNGKPHTTSSVWKTPKGSAGSLSKIEHSVWRITSLFNEKSEITGKSYYEQCQKADGSGKPYLSRNAEMFARAFEAYVDFRTGGDTGWRKYQKGKYSAIPIDISLKTHEAFDDLLGRVAGGTIKKSVDVVNLPKGVHLTPEEMKSMKLTWVTAHPNGKGSDPGIPLIVHDNGDHYVVVGGAGGKLNQMVMKKSGDPGGLKKAGNEQAAEAKKKLKESDPEAFKNLETAAKDYKEKSKQAVSEHVQSALEMLGQSLPEVKAKAAEAARAKAKEEMPEATEEQVQAFVDDAEKAAEGQAKKAVESSMASLLDAVAKAQLMQQAAGGQDISVELDGKTLTKTLTPKQVDELVKGAVNIDMLKTAESAVRRAMRTGKTAELPGVEAFTQSADDVAEWVKHGYLQREAIKRQVAIVEQSSGCSKASQKRNQAMGASDALNAVAAVATGSAILSPDAVEHMGVENAARVVAAHLKASGVDVAQMAGRIGDSIAGRVDEHVAAALQMGADMDALAKTAIDAAESGEGLVTHAQAYIVKRNQAERKFQVLNLARGHAQSAAALLWHLSNPSKSPMVVPGGTSELATHVKAKSMGLDKGDYEVRNVGSGGFEITVNHDAVSKLAKPMSADQSQRALSVAKLKHEAQVGGAGSWKPQSGWQDGSGTDSHGNKCMVELLPHQIAAARAIVENGKMILSYGAGTGKTAIYYAAAAELLHTGKVKRGIITMPAKPRSQQEDYSEKGADGKVKKKPGEKTKFLQKEMGDQFTVVSDTKDLMEKLERVKSGELAVLIMSPEMMRKHADTLSAAGFGGDDSFFFGDEAHELAIGEKDKGADGDPDGSGKARAARGLAQSSGYVAMGSGTLVENDGSELYSALNFVDPKAFPDEGRGGFADRWERQASIGKDGVMSPEMLQSLASEVGGYMMHHFQAPTGPGGKPVTLDSRSEVVPLDAASKSAIIEANKQREADEVSPDENVRKSAALMWSARVQRACIGPAMFDQITDYVGERRNADPTYKAVVWSQELEPIKELTERLGKHGKVVTITGSQNDAETKKAIEAFQNDPDVAAVVISNAANFGVNLQAGHSVIKCGFPPVPSKDQQLDARIFRHGQERDVETVTFLGDHPLVRQAYENMHSVKGRSMDLLSSLADDSLMAGLLQQHGGG